MMPSNAALENCQEIVLVAVDKIAHVFHQVVHSVSGRRNIGHVSVLAVQSGTPCCDFQSEVRHVLVIRYTYTGAAFQEFLRGR